MKNKSFKKAKNLALALVAGAFFMSGSTIVKADSNVTWKAPDGHQLKNDWLYKWGQDYYFKSNGQRATNESVKIDGQTYYFNGQGVLQKNYFENKNGKVYYYNGNGEQESNYFYKNWGHTYYFGKDGARYTNRFYNNWGHTYYFGSDGALYTNKLYSNWGHQYYFGSDGALVTNTDVNVNGITYHADKNGVLSRKTVHYARSYGGDYSKYQPSLYNNTGKDEFAITQMGGSENGYIYDQSTYTSHIQQSKARGWRMHQYIWDQTGSNQYQTQQMLNYFLRKIQTPYGSIVALDYEAGASGNVEANTDNILLGMRMIKQAGFTPMLYSYKPYLMAHVDVNRVLAEFPNSLWVAGYQSGLSVWPNYNAFPGLSNTAIWQYSDYGGQQDLNVDLTGITYNGY